LYILDRTINQLKVEPNSRTKERRQEMPRLAKGAKETFGWVQISRQRKILIPPDAWERYGFQVGEQAIFLRANKGTLYQRAQSFPELEIYTKE
jgi:hypothetical protein